MQASPLISICVPVYNGEHVLRRCLDSIVSQTFTDIEIIVVNDGSTDNSGSIIETYLATEHRIKCISKTKNEGPSWARKTAVQQATGIYIGFVDSDDWIAPDMMEKLYMEAERTKADIVVCNYLHKDNIHRSKKKVLKLHKEAFSKDHPSFAIFPQGVNPTYWNKLFKRALFFENTLTFLSLFQGEDLIVTAQLYFFAQRIGVVDESLYYYDISGRKEKRSNRITEFLRDELSVTQRLFDFFVPRHQEQALKVFLLNRQAVLYTYAYDVICSKNKEAKNLLKQLIAKYYNSSSSRHAVRIFFVMKLERLTEGYIPSILFRAIRKLFIYINLKLSL